MTRLEYLRWFKERLENYPAKALIRGTLINEAGKCALGAVYLSYDTDLKAFECGADRDTLSRMAADYIHWQHFGIASKNDTFFHPTSYSRGNEERYTYMLKWVGDEIARLEEHETKLAALTPLDDKCEELVEA